MTRWGDAAGRRFVRPAFRVLRQLDQLLMPPTCPVCNMATSDGRDAMCEACSRMLSVSAAATYCRRCGRAVNPLAITEKNCVLCRKERHWNLAGLVRTGSYPAELRKLLIDLKYAGGQRSIEPLAVRIASALRGEVWISKVEALVPVPMHWLRRLQRPCNHAYVLAEAVGRAVGIPLLDACRRVRYRPSQTTAKSRSKRIENVAKCFGMRRRVNVRGMTVCIVDNLLVTGATVCEVSKALRKAGAKKIFAVVAARTVSAGDFQAADEAVAAVGG